MPSIDIPEEDPEEVKTILQNLASELNDHVSKEYGLYHSSISKSLKHIEQV